MDILHHCCNHWFSESSLMYLDSNIYTLLYNYVRNYGMSCSMNSLLKTIYTYIFTFYNRFQRSNVNHFRSSREHSCNTECSRNYKRAIAISYHIIAKFRFNWRPEKLRSHSMQNRSLHNNAKRIDLLWHENFVIILWYFRNFFEVIKILTIQTRTIKSQIALTRGPSG